VRLARQTDARFGSNWSTQLTALLLSGVATSNRERNQISARTRGNGRRNRPDCCMGEGWLGEGAARIRGRPLLASGESTWDAMLMD
jgi:hypothetical protein